jgi:protein TonB
MEAVWIIIGLVFGFSVYDFWTSRSWTMVTSEERNNLIFEKKNKEYGAFKLRKNYDKNLMFILVGVFSLSTLFCAGYAAMNKNLPAAITKETQAPTIETKMVEITFEPKQTPEIPVEEKQVTEQQATTQFIEPTVIDKQVKEETKTQEDLEKTLAGNKDQEGKGNEFGKPGEKKQEGSEKKQEETQQNTITNKTEDWVDEEAEYPGGIKEMIAFIQKNLDYPEYAAQINIQGKCYLKFIVGSDGKIEEVNVIRGIPGCPECDKEASRVIRTMPKWKPGKIKGKAVRSYFNLPITFELE